MEKVPETRQKTLKAQTFTRWFASESTIAFPSESTIALVQTENKNENEEMLKQIIAIHMPKVKVQVRWLWAALDDNPNAM